MISQIWSSNEIEAIMRFQDPNRYKRLGIGQSDNLEFHQATVILVSSNWSESVTNNSHLHSHDNMKDLNKDILKKAVKYHQVKFVAQGGFQIDFSSLEEVVLLEEYPSHTE